MRINKVLVANRGEIALRVIRACHELQLSTVAVYSVPDEASLWVRQADEAFFIGNAPPEESYLRIDKIIEVAKKSNADAIHPGYGFLAENPRFARACEENSITFIGPQSECVAKMGDKVEARRVMRKAGIPITPGSEEAISDLSEARKTANKLGYPVIIKPSGGGGGIGIRVVRHEEELATALNSTQSLASSAFGNPDVLIEKYLRDARHIEFQILGDKYGKIIHLGERECSIQRRYQKLIEEAPSLIMTEELRRRIGAIAVKAGKTLQYENAGTIEFIYSQGKFYFNEVNTRLQVEHPVTEMVTRLDLVKEQLKIAAGEKLGYNQADICMDGHAIECRINAEDPNNNFMPTPGIVWKYILPGGHGVRVDSALHEGCEISQFYDPLVAKLIVWGETRGEAIARMARALNEYIIIGIKTTIPYHKLILANEDFISGNLSTTFIQRIHSEVDEKKIAAISAAVKMYLGKEVTPVVLRTKEPLKLSVNRWAIAGRHELMRGSEPIKRSRLYEKLY